MTAAKIKFLLGYNMKIVIQWGESTFGREGIKIWWEKGIFPGGGRRMSKFLAGGGGFPHPTSTENPEVRLMIKHALRVFMLFYVMLLCITLISHP